MKEQASRYDPLGRREAAIDENRAAPGGRQPRRYRIICVIRRSDGHPRAGYSANGNGVIYDGTWTIAEALHVIEQGHQLYTVSPSSGDEAELEIHDGRLRTKPNPNIDTNLANLPDCSPR